MITKSETKIINKIKYFAEKYGHEKTIIEFEEEILSFKSAYISNFFAINIKDANIKAHEKVVLDSENPYYSLLFARDIEDADVFAHGNVVLKSNNPHYNLWFACDVKGADVDAHLEIAKTKGDPILAEVIDLLLINNTIDIDEYNLDVNSTKKLLKEMKVQKTEHIKG